MSGISPKASGAEQDNRDLFCLHCGYNLRGLSGDPRRCPECGKLNPIGDLVVPASEILRQFRQMETGPAFCMLCVLSIMGVVVSAIGVGISSQPGSAHACFVVVSIMAVVGWSLSAVYFQKSCIGKPGCWMALWNYHVYGLVASGLFFGPTVAVLWLFVSVAWLTKPGFVACESAAIAVSWYGVRWAYRRATEDMRQLQRDVAVQLARDYLRRRMGRRSGWLKGKE